MEAKITQGCAKGRNKEKPAPGNDAGFLSNNL